MPKSLPYFKWYPADAETDENFRAMSDAEVGFYLRCLNHSWLNHGIPADANERARALNRKPSQIDRMWTRVGKCFDVSPNDQTRLINRRQEEERSKAVSKSESATNSVRTRYERSTAGQPERSANEPPHALARGVSDSVSESDKQKTCLAKKSAHPSLRFDEWWQRWSAVRGTNHRSRAEHVYLREVTEDTEANCFECTASYLASLDNPARGFNPENFLMEQASDKFTARWPSSARSQKPNGNPQDIDYPEYKTFKERG